MSSGEGKAPGAKHRLLLVGATTALALMVLIVVTTARRDPILRSPDRDPNIDLPRVTYQAPTLPPVSKTATGTPTGSHAGTGTFAGILRDIMLGALLLLLLWLIVASAMSLMRRWREHRRVRRAGPLPEVDDAVLDSVAQATGRQQQLILEGTPSNAIVACWVDLEHAVAAAGVERRPSETSAELTIRVLDALDIDRPALRDLGALYREARFSAHQLTEQERASARDALTALHRSLRATTEERV